ncbi:MAG: nucleotidyltransferase family protein [Chlamydiae bacterium]|nr:nucleotidyltransferase family protein [Chlamydiota bacterium]MBI3278011.1 nucleotidyltransferase family protein [Chlamydiota bacterium]
MSCVFRFEEELLICCAQGNISSQKRERVFTLLQGKIDWHYFYEIMSRHRLKPILYQNFDRYFSQSVSQPFFAELYEQVQSNLRQSLLITQSLIQILNGFKEKRIFALCYDGPALAEMIYKNFSLQHSTDLNIFIHRSDVLKAQALLEAQGYAPRFKPKKQKNDLICHRCQETLTGHGIFVHLHWAIEPNSFLFPDEDTNQRLWENPESVSLGGTPLQTFSPENWILILCLHGAKHGWRQLNTIGDIAALIEVYPCLNWKEVLEKACQLHKKRILLLGLYLAMNLFEAPIPQEIIQKIEKDVRVKFLAEKVRGKLFQKRRTGSRFLDDFFFLRTLESYRDKIRFCLNYARPTPLEWRLFSVPRGLYFIYYFVRPIRLIIKYFIRLFKHPLKRDLAIFVPTSLSAVDRMLELAAIGPNDIVYDLGCGDGRMVIRAAQKCGARGIGIDIDSKLVCQAQEKAREEGVDPLVKFSRADVKKALIQDATVVMLSLPSSAYPKLKTLLQNQLRQGTRIVTRRLFMDDFPMIKQESFWDSSGIRHTLYLYHVITNHPDKSIN